MTAPLLPLPLPRLAWSDHPALAYGPEVITYRELAAASDELARRLAGLGLGRGDRLALLLPNGPRFAALVHAAARLQAILVPLNTRLTATEIGWQIDQVEPRVLVYHPELGDALAGLGSDVLTVATADGGASERAGRSEAREDPVLDALPALDLDLADHVALDTPHSIIFTSGTTGRPKGAVLTHGNHLWSAMDSALRLGHLPGDRWLVPLPLYHVGGLAVLLRCAWHGTTAVLHPRFDPQAVAHSLADGAISRVSLVPTMLARLLDAWGDRPAPSGLRVVLLGGGPAPPELLERATALGFPLAPTYGLTEAASQVTTVAPGRSPVKPLGAGAPLAFTSVRITDPDGRALAPGQEGEIQVRGPTVMAGYWHDPDATAEALVDGWLRTGDLGRLDEDGELVVLARRDDVVVTGGENVYPAEVEAVLSRYPGVADCCVVGLPDAEWGAIVAAAVVPAPGAQMDGPALQVYLREHLAGYKVPRCIVWLDELPRNTAGKVRRGEVRAQLSGSSGKLGST